MVGGFPADNVSPDRQKMKPAAFKRLLRQINEVVFGQIAGETGQGVVHVRSPAVAERHVSLFHECESPDGQPEEAG